MQIQKQVGIYDRYPPSDTRLAEGGLRTFGQMKSDREDLPLVSIVTVVKDAASTLQRCIDSVQRQTYGNVEHIVVDGASTDGTLDILKANDNVLDYYVSEPDAGIYAAMNKGVMLAQGRFLAMLNADDWLFPEGVEKLVEGIIEEKADLAIGYANFINDDGKHFYTSAGTHFDDRILVSGMTFCHQATLAHRDCFRAAGLFDESLRLSGDYKWFQRLFLAGREAAVVAKPVVNFSYTGLTKTHRPIMKQEAKQLFLENFDFASPEEAHTLFEWVYRDAPLNMDLLELLRRARGDSQFMTSLSMQFLQRLVEAESQLKEVRSAKQAPIRTDAARLMRRILRKIVSYVRRAT